MPGLDLSDLIVSLAHPMTLVIRNTFLHITHQHEDDDQRLPHGRSNSAPPTHRQTNRDKGEHDSAVDSTVCDTLEHDASTIASDFDDDAMSPRSSLTEHEDVSPPMTSRHSDSDDDDAKRQNSVANATITQEAAQQQLDQMSEKVMDLWSKLRSIESSLLANSEDVVDPAAAGASSPTLPSPPAEAEKETVETPATSTTQQSTSISARRVPTEVQSLLASAKSILMRIPGVVGVGVNMGAVGTLTTITVRLQPASLKSLLLQCVVTTLKSALLDLAANSQSIYVLGYEVQPFQDEASGKGFATVLASMPPAWECSACWDLYSKGACQRRKTCKWQHPGRNELQPLRVVVC